MLSVVSVRNASARLTWMVTGTTRNSGQSRIMIGGVRMPARSARNSVWRER
jgi:hypothetical protein